MIPSAVEVVLRERSGRPRGVAWRVAVASLVALSWFVGPEVASAQIEEAAIEEAASDAEAVEAELAGEPPEHAADELGSPLMPRRVEASRGLEEPIFELPPEEPEGPLADPWPIRLSLADVSGASGPLGAAWVELVGGVAESGQGVAAVFSPSMGMRFAMGEETMVSLRWGFTVAHAEVSGELIRGGEALAYDSREARVEPGNPVLGFAYAAGDDALRGRVGVELGVPMAARPNVPDDAESAAERAASEVVNRAAMAVRGFWSAWEFAPERASIALPGRLAGRIEGFRLAVEGALAFMIPVLGDRAVDPDVVFQLALEGGYEVVGPLVLGARIGGVGSVVGQGLPPFVLLAEPVAALELEPVLLSLRGTMILAGEGGLGEGSPSFGVSVGAGGMF